VNTTSLGSSKEPEMYAHRRMLLVGAALAGVPLFGAPAFASVRYDPDARTGFVDGSDVRAAFGWSSATLAARAAGLVFGHDFTTVDTYAVVCGGAAFPVEHPRVFGRFELTDVVVPRSGRAAAAGYGGRSVGFRLTGARSGISGTSVAPAPGQPCPRGGGAVSRVRLVSTTTGWTLTVDSGDVRRELLTTSRPQPAPSRGTASPRPETSHPRPCIGNQAREPIRVAASGWRPAGCRRQRA
jgi:hypothetical protein